MLQGSGAASVIMPVPESGQCSRKAEFFTEDQGQASDQCKRGALRLGPRTKPVAGSGDGKGGKRSEGGQHPDHAGSPPVHCL